MTVFKLHNFFRIKEKHLFEIDIVGQMHMKTLFPKNSTQEKPDKPEGTDWICVIFI